MSWRERLIREPGLADMVQWPVIDPGSLPSKARKSFLTNQRIVARVLANASCCEVARAFGCSKGHVSQLMNRCLGGDLDEPAALTPALVPYHRLGATQRQKTLPCLSEKAGTMGAFKALLAQLPAVKATLDKAILEDHKRTPTSQRLTASSLHQALLRALVEVHWPMDRYPFTSLSRGYESVRRYFIRRKLELGTPKPRGRRFTELESSVSDHRALATIQIDEHLLHLHGSLAVQFNDELINLRLRRCSLLLAVDVATQCILGFELRPTGAPNQDDLLALFDRCLTPRPVREIHTPGFDALAVPAMPAEADLAWPLTFGTVQFDNAWIHHSNAVEEFLCSSMGASISWGLAGQPKTRALVEHVFDYLERKLGHRFDATTGSHPKDSKRESTKNAKRVPALSYHSLVEAIHLMIGQYNNTPMPQAAGYRPLELFQHHLRHHWIRWSPGGADRGWQPFQSRLTLPVHRSAREQRAPYLQFCYCRYSGDGLLSLTPEETEVIVHINRRDIRTLNAYTTLGRPLGTLYAPRSWRRFAHTQATRQWLFQQKRMAKFDASDPITGYFLDLLSEKRTPDVAAHILALYQEISPSGQHWLAVGEEAITAMAVEDPVVADPFHDGFSQTQYRWAPPGIGGPGRF